MSEKAMVLCSGGVDSTTCLALAVEKYGRENVSALSIYYGQKHVREIEAAKKVLEYYGVEGTSLDLTPVFAYSDCSLLSHSTEEVPEESYAEQLKSTHGAPVTTYVPFRNGLFLSAAASVALSKGAASSTTAHIMMMQRKRLPRLQRGIRECDEPVGRRRYRRPHCASKRLSSAGTRLRSSGRACGCMSPMN